MNVRKRVYDLLTVHMGCDISERSGIWFITTPHGVEWDMTVPLAADEKDAWNTVSSSKDLPERKHQ